LERRERVGFHFVGELESEREREREREREIYCGFCSGSEELICVRVYLYKVLEELICVRVYIYKVLDE
jgi:DUF1680 family protein